MRDISELIKNVEKYKDIIIQFRYKSKKNTVAYVTIDGKPRVLKWFVPGLKKQMKVEMEILKDSTHMISIPTLFDVDEENNVLIMGYIPGGNLCDIINGEYSSKEEKQRIMALLAKWYADFHSHFKNGNIYRIRGDSNIRNFIFNDKIWGVDFEESRAGLPKDDIARLCESVLTSGPMFTKEKFALCNIFLDSYSKLMPEKIKNISDEISYALLEKVPWRPKDEKLLREYSKIIKQKGIEKAASVF